MTPQTITFASSPFWPIAIGFFGLGTGYFIWGGQALFWLSEGWPRSRSDHGYVGVLDARLCQFLTGVYLIVGLTWFGVFANAAPLYMAGVAFTVSRHPGGHRYALGLISLQATFSRTESSLEANPKPSLLHSMFHKGILLRIRRRLVGGSHD